MNRIEITKSAADFFLLHRRRCLAAVISPPSSRSRCLTAVAAVIVAVNVASYQLSIILLGDSRLPVGGPHCPHLQVRWANAGSTALSYCCRRLRGSPWQQSTPSGWSPLSPPPGEVGKCRTYCIELLLSSPQRVVVDVRELTTFRYRLTLLCRVRLPQGPRLPWPSTSFSRKNICP